MKLTVFSLFWGFWGISSYSSSSTAGAKPVLSPPEKALTVYGVEGRNVTFPCSICASLQTSHLVEWWREDRSSQVTMFVLRDGRELVKDKAQEYVNRTTMQKDGALTLSKVKLQDNGTYRVSLKGRDGLVQKYLFSLILVEASKVSLTIRPNSEGAPELLCESIGWRLQPVNSVLDDQRNALTAQTVKWTGESDGHYSVNATAIGNGTLICRVGIPDLNLWRESEISFKGNGTLICRVGIPDLNLWRESKINLTGDFRHSWSGSSWFLLGAVFTAVVFAVVQLFVTPFRGAVAKLRLGSFGGSVENCLSSPICTKDTPDYNEYEDIAKITPTGASDRAQQQHTKAQHQHSTSSHAYEGLSGLEVSNQLAGRDPKLMTEYQDVTTVGNSDDGDKKALDVC
ncbi:uncharacterized protein LOC143010740 isoform X2 [Genypterus blacodes]|uniref:uncharacterized protein LOC143010740 isoform X2 n=1 Tax=Genypterus blacodes TaxID=154954 RepID=UPI003F7755E3